MHHHIKYMYINFQQNRISRSVKNANTNLFANNRKLQHAIQISKPTATCRSFCIDIYIIELIFPKFELDQWTQSLSVWQLLINLANHADGSCVLRYMANR